MTALQKLKSLLESKGIYQQTKRLLREHRRLTEVSIVNDPDSWITPKEVLDRQNPRSTPTTNGNTIAEQFHEWINHTDKNAQVEEWADQHGFKYKVKNFRIQSPVIWMEYTFSDESTIYERVDEDGDREIFLR